MRVTIDATSTLVRSAGVKNYIWHWLRYLREQAGPGVDIEAFPFLGRDSGALDHEASALSKSATIARLLLIRAMNTTGLPRLEWVIQESDVFHATNLLRRAPKRAKLTATVHDLTCWLMPEVHTPENVIADKGFAGSILQKADGLIAVSENTRLDAIRLLGVAPDRIQTIYSGVAGSYYGAVPVPRVRPYVLYVGTIEPRKNLGTLLDAWALLKSSLRAEFDLVIAGPRGWSSHEAFARIQQESIYLGYVPEADLPGLTAAATAFVYPSLYEGFGFPVVQAMAAGAPVLTSNNSCLPEIAGDAALLVDPRSPTEIAAGLTGLLESPSLRSDFTARGRQRAELFRWEKCATQSLQFFRSVCGSV